MVGWCSTFAGPLGSAVDAGWCWLLLAVLWCCWLMDGAGYCWLPAGCLLLAADGCSCWLFVVAAFNTPSCCFSWLLLFLSSRSSCFWFPFAFSLWAVLDHSVLFWAALGSPGLFCGVLGDDGLFSGLFWAVLGCASRYTLWKNRCSDVMSRYAFWKHRCSVVRAGTHFGNIHAQMYEQVHILEASNVRAGTHFGKVVELARKPWKS